MDDILDDLTVVVTTIPTRLDRLQIALKSIYDQIKKPVDIIVQVDFKKQGAAINRTNGLYKVKTKWVAFLDDDDYFLPDHLETLYNTAVQEDADLVYSWFDVIGGSDPFPQNFRQPWNPNNPVQTTVTTLGKTKSYVDVEGFLYNDRETVDLQGDIIGEDYLLTLKINDKGGKIVHVPKKTWHYVHWISENGTIGNTSGRPDRW